MEAEDKTTERLRFDGELTIASADVLHKRLLDALRTHHAVEVDCSAATEIDVSFVQLLIAASRAAREWGKSFTVTGIAQSALGSALARAGLACATDEHGTPGDILRTRERAAA